MFRTRGNKIWRDVRARLGRTALVSCAIFIGVAGTIAIFSMSFVLVGQLQEDIKPDELPMITIYGGGTSPTDEAKMAGMEEIPGITDIVGLVINPMRFKLSADQEDYDDGSISSFTVDYAEGLPLIPLRLVEGDYPARDQKQVAVEQRMAEQYDLGVGDSVFINILSPNSEGEVNTLEEWTITGVVFHPYSGLYGQNVQPQTAVYGYIPEANYIGGTIGLGGFMTRFTDYDTAVENEELLTNFVANDMDYLVGFVQKEDPAQNQLVRSVATLAGTMSFLAIIALVVSGFLVVNVISSIVVEQKRQIGVMKSIGASTWDNFLIYTGMAFAYGMIGVAIGVPVGVLGGNVATQALAPELNTVIEGFQFSIPAIIIGVVVGLAIPVFAALIPVAFGTRVTILEALTDLGIDANYGSGPLAKLISLLPVPITVRQGLSNISIKKVRLIFTVITLSIAVGAFMGIFAFFSNLTSGINNYLESFNVQVGVFPTQVRNVEGVERILKSEFPNIESIEPGFLLQVEFEGYEPVASAGGPPGIFAYGYDINSDTPAFNFTIDEGNQLDDSNAANGVIFSSQLAKNMKVKIGDTVTIKVPGNQQDLIIQGISEYPLDQVWLDWRLMALLAGYTSAEITSPIPMPQEAQSFIQYASPLTVAESELVALGFSADAVNFLSGVVTEGALYKPGANEVVISAGLAQAQNLSLGDTISVTSTQADGSSADYTIVGILTLPAQVTEGGLPSDFIGLFWEDLATLDGQDLTGEPRPAGYFVVTNIDEPTVRQSKDFLEDVNETMLANGLPIQSFNFVELVEQINQGFVIFQLILQAVALLIALVGALGLFTTLSMSVFERQKEIGVMRSIGAGSGTIISQFLTEGLVTGIIAWIIGLPLAFGILAGLFSITGFGGTFASDFPPLAAVLGLAGMLGITFVASIWPSLSASRKTVSDILRYQ